jgi:para-aminobenzoate synthetase/4-amino-4-deoxychorismate lyase
MKIISQLETTPRRIYTGCIGYFSPDRKAEFNVAIRTALIDQETGQAEYGVGGGVVWDSLNDDEYAEALLKAQVLTEPRSDFSIFETMLWTPEEGFFLSKKHILRMADSAEYFGFSFSEDKLEKYLDSLSASFKMPQRVRITLDRSGELAAHTSEYAPQNTPFRVRLAAAPIDSSDVFLFHKTTRRQIYEDALAVPQMYNDVLLHNQNGELTEFTIGNLVVDMAGQRYTPPIECGVLPGTYRAFLLDTRQITERTIKVDELQQCRKIYLINSVRKWVEVEFA